MALLNEQTNLVIRQYIRKAFPTLEVNLNTYLPEELQRIENAVNALADAAIQATDVAPEKPRRGTVRYNVLPWDPLSDNSEGLVVYNGTTWVAV